MSHSARGMISESLSGSATRQQSESENLRATREFPLHLELRDATSQMWRRLTVGIPRDIQNIIFDFTRSEPRFKRGHLLGSWPRVSESLARAGAPLTDITAPVAQHISNLKRDFYRTELPSLEAIEQREADDECKLHKAEICRDALALKEAARDMADVAEILAEVADRELQGAAK